MLNHDKGKSGVNRHFFKKTLDGFQAAGGGADAHIERNFTRHVFLDRNNLIVAVAAVCG